MSKLKKFFSSPNVYSSLGLLFGVVVMGMVYLNLIERTIYTEIIVFISLLFLAGGTIWFLIQKYNR